MLTEKEERQILWEIIRKFQNKNIEYLYYNDIQFRTSYRQIEVYAKRIDKEFLDLIMGLDKKKVEFVSISAINVENIGSIGRLGVWCKLSFKLKDEIRYPERYKKKK
jgi:hypothetical protein